MQTTTKEGAFELREARASELPAARLMRSRENHAVLHGHVLIDIKTGAAYSPHLKLLARDLLRLPAL